jgi:hypothetical protein
MAENWQPIETAPKDGTDILVGFVPAGRQLVAHWKAEVKAWVIVDQSVVHPTHWTELPQNPATPVVEAHKEKP